MSSIRKQFILTINSFTDINFDHSDVEFLKQLGCNGIVVDSGVYDDLCENTIDYCYQAIRESGEVISSGTRDNLSSLIGDYLFRILLKNRVEGKLLKNKVGDELIKSIDENDNKKDENEKEDLQLILKFTDSEDAKKLAKCPWEYLHYANEQDPNKSYSLLAKIKVYRVYNKPSSGIETLKKLNVLVFFSPRKGQFEERHITELQDLFKKLQNDYGDKVDKDNKEKIIKGNFAYNFIFPQTDNSDSNATYDTFLTTVNQFKPDVIHYIGEAQYKDDKEELFFWDQSGLDFDAKGKTLLDDFYSGLKKSISHGGLKLVIFQTWNNFDNGAYLAFKKIAVKLIDNNLPAVISVPYSFHLPRTNNFTTYKNKIAEFYSSLIEEGKSLSDSIFSLRNSLKIAGKGYPIVYLGSSDIDGFKVQPMQKSGDEQTTKDEKQTMKGLANTIQPTANINTEGPNIENQNSFTKTMASGRAIDTQPDHYYSEIAVNTIIKNINNFRDIEQKLPSIENTNELNKEKNKLKSFQELIIINLQSLYKNDSSQEKTKFSDSKKDVIDMIDKLSLKTEENRQYYTTDAIMKKGSDEEDKATENQHLMEERKIALEGFRKFVNEIYK